MKLPSVYFLFIIFSVSAANSIESSTENWQGNLQKFVCFIQKFIKSLKLKPNEKLKFIFNPFEVFPTVDDVLEVINTPKYLLANILAVFIIFKLIAVFGLLTFLIYGRYFNSLF
jgi:hypothetical protein